MGHVRKQTFRGSGCLCPQALQVMLGYTGLHEQGHIQQEALLLLRQCLCEVSPGLVKAATQGLPPLTAGQLSRSPQPEHFQIRGLKARPLGIG